MVSPHDLLSEAAYKNYRNVRAVALLFIILGSIFLLGGLSVMVNPEQVQQSKSFLKDPAVATGFSIVGLAGVIGGIATRRGNRKWAPLVKVMAWLYIWGFPIGTILSWTLLDGFSQYLKSIDRIRRAEEEDDEYVESDRDEEDWDDEEGDRLTKRRNPHRESRVQAEQEVEEEDEKPRKDKQGQAVGDEEDDDLPKKKRKPKDEEGGKSRVMPIFIGGLVLFVLLGVMGYFYGKKKEDDTAGKQTPDPIKTTQITPKTESERAKFQGVWKYLSLEVNGKQALPGVVREFVYRFDGTQYNNARNGQVQSKGSFSLDTSKSPAWIDLAESTNITIYGIYRFDGDRLTICLHEKQRPTTFEPPPGRGFIILVLEPDTALQTEFPESSLTPKHAAAAKELQGEWLTIAYNGNGIYTPVQRGREVPYTFEGNKQITVNPFNGRQEIEYRLDPTKTPKQFDQRFTGGTMGPWIAKGIYKVEGDTLTICHGGPKVARPDDFTTSPGDGRSMLVLRRVK